MAISINTRPTDAEFIKELVGNKKVNGSAANGGGVVFSYSNMVYYANGYRFTPADDTLDLDLGDGLYYIYGKDDETVVRQMTTTSSINYTLLGMAEVVGGVIDTFSAVENATIGSQLVKNNLAAGGAPSVTDDEVQGYSRGSVWVSPTISYVCLDATVGAAVWDSTNSGIPPGTVNLGFSFDCGSRGTVGSGTVLDRADGVSTNLAAFVVPWASEIKAVSASAASIPGTSADIRIHKNGIGTPVETLTLTATSGYKISTAISMVAGDLLTVDTGNYLGGGNISNLGMTIFCEKS